MANTIGQQFQQQIESIGTERKKLINKSQYLPLLRLVLFMFSLILFYKYLTLTDIFFIYLLCTTLVLFIIFTWFDSRLKVAIERCDRLIEICTHEINSLNGDFSSFDPGDEYIDPDHSYTYDLDLFGQRSLFHCLNRSVTIFGKNRLADYLKSAFQYKNHIIERQKAVRELSENQEFRQQMQLVFFGKKSNESDRVEFIEWLKLDNALSKNRLFNILRFSLPVITGGLIILSSMGQVVVQLPIMMVIIQLLVVSMFGRKTIRVQALLTSKVETISKYAHFLLLIGNTNMNTPFLKELKRQLSHEGIEAPSKILRQLFRLLNWMDTNLNIIASVILNGLFLFNLHLLAAVEKWKSSYSDVIPRWFAVIGEIDALASLANFTHNNPEYIFPEPSEEQFIFEAINLGHPLIPIDDCVTNTISITGWNQYCIITGANMSGKSTFLRTVGANYILAMLGAPVYATSFTFCPVILHSSIRTNDSLARKESFFYAELKRLKSIITELESGQRTFILLDEILKGTNSKDKQAGSIALLEQLIKYQSVGLIATHDLILGDLIRNYPRNIRNLCFEIQIVNDEMSIDYKLQDGICQNLNATFLMKKMGILIDNRN
jgi:DNA mismatch repair ATPase MutS